MPRWALTVGITTVIIARPHRVPGCGTMTIDIQISGEAEVPDATARESPSPGWDHAPPVGDLRRRADVHVPHCPARRAGCAFRPARVDRDHQLRIGRLIGFEDHLRRRLPDLP